MPGLPRKSSADQFKKLMKKSGKSKTNKSSGGVDPTSRKIATYEQYFTMKENAHEDIDPYNEEDWNENIIDLDEKLAEIYNWLSMRLEILLNGKHLGYDLMYSSLDEMGIELFKPRDGVLVEDRDFYYGIFLDEERCWSNYRCLSNDKHKTQLHSDHYMSLDGDEYKGRSFDDFKRVVESILYHKNPPRRNILGIYY